MRTLAQAYKKLKRESTSFKLTKDEFVLYVAILFPMFKTELLKLPIRREHIFIPGSTNDLPSFRPNLNFVEIRFPDLWDYLNKRVIKLQEKF